MREWATLLTAIAAVAWPLVTMTALLMFRRDIRSLVGRFKRGKLLGQELELSETVQQLDAVASAARAQLPAVGVPLPNPRDGQVATQGPDSGQVERRKQKILEESIVSPKAGLMLLGADIEVAGRRLLASLGLLKGRRSIPLAEIIRTLRNSGLVPGTLVRSVETFLQVRNKIVHGRGAASDDDILSALDSGFTILDALEAVPHAIHVVAHAGLELYADGAGEKILPGGTAMILEARKSTGEPGGTNIVPTTRTNYRPGQRVAWEWNPEKDFDEAWYRDPETGTIKHAWSSSMEFSGRPLDEV